MAGRYNWKSGVFPQLDEHSAAKHRVLRRYVENYIQILCLNPRSERLRLIVVDGFCGGGIYQDINGILRPGSPLILREALQAGRANVELRRKNIGLNRPFDLDATLYLNDIDPSAIAMLNSQLAKCDNQSWAPRIEVTNYDFEVLARRLIASFRGQRGSPRILFVLDQYGLTDASLPVMRSIFSAFPKAEIVLTFAVDTLANFASPKTIDLYRKILAKTGFDEVVTAEQLAKLKAEDDAAKHVIQTLLLREVFPQTGASYATPFFIIPKQSRRGYWLLHLANNARANDEMKSLHWHEHNHFMHFGAEGVGILAFDPMRLERSSQYTFDFGDAACERTRVALTHDLPRLLRDQFSDGTTIGSVLEAVTNDTPATRDMVRSALFELGSTRDFEVKTAHGRTRKHVGRLQLEDEIYPRRQIILL